MARKMLRNVEKREFEAARNGPSDDGKRWQHCWVRYPFPEKLVDTKLRM